MLSNSRPECRKNSHDNVFAGLLVGEKEANLLATYFAQHDFSPHTRRAITGDLRKFVRWFTTVNQEPFTVKRATLRDVTDFRNHLHRERRQAVASVNRALVSIRRFFDWLAQEGQVSVNPAKKVKELRRQKLHPRDSTGPMCGGGCERLNCGRMCEPGRSSACSSILGAESATW